jgi:hypothetical protein
MFPAPMIAIFILVYRLLFTVYRLAFLFFDDGSYDEPAVGGYGLWPSVMQSHQFQSLYEGLSVVLGGHTLIEVIRKNQMSICYS